ncbi:MAG: hypothetical protein KGM49_05515 [Sphingomonadales bacterium]|nr:hypothetical protein [Sphingomonadales bacterium]
MAAMVIGYLFGIALIPRFVNRRQALIGCGLLGLLFLVGILTSDPASHSLSDMLWGWAGYPGLPNPITFVALLGLANALVWPTV